MNAKEHTEVWKAIPVATRYEASSLGRVRRVSDGYILKPKTSNAGYLVTGVIDNEGVRKHSMVHRLVAMAFHGMPAESMQCCHNDGVRTNNKASNLRWDTIEKNHADKNEHGTALVGEKHPGAVLTDEKVKRIAELFRLGMSAKEISQKLHISYTTIGRVTRGESWAWASGLPRSTRRHNRTKYGSTLTEQQVLKIVDRVRSGEMPSQVQRDYPVSASMVRSIMRGDSWSRITGIKKGA